MGGKFKKVAKYIVLLYCVMVFTGCSKDKEIDFANYLNNTLEYFINDTGFQVERNDDGIYENEEKGIQINVKDNLIQKIEITSTIMGYDLGDAHIADKKKKVEKLIEDVYTSQPEVSTEEEGQSSAYAYQKGNRLFTVTYNSDNLVEKLAMEVTPYTVGSVSTNAAGESQIAKGDIMVTVGNIDVSYSEAMVYLRTAQQIYETEFGNDVWGYDIYGNGTTVGAILKQEVLNQIIQLEVINMVANEEGILLNDDEMFEVRSMAADFIKELSEEEKLKYGITEDLVVQVFAANQIAEKLYETKTIDVDTEVSDEEAQQCRIYKLFLRTYGEDSKGNRTQLRDSEIKEIHSKAKELHKQAMEGADFYTLAEANSDDNVIEFVVGRGELDSKEEAAAFSLKDGEVSDILESEDGYTILYCVDAYDEDATLQVKESIIEQRRSTLFVNLYTEWYSKYEVKVNMDLWNRLELSPLSVKEE